MDLKKVLGWGVGFIVAFVVFHIVSNSSGKIKKFESYRSESGRFSIMFPGKPSESTRQTQTVAGLLDFTMYTCKSGKYTFLVAYCDYPKEAVVDPNSVLDGVKNGIASSVKGAVISSRGIKFERSLGREFEIRTDKSNDVIEGRIYLVKARLYEFMVVSPMNKRLSSEASFKFFNSLAIE